jgi:hypothetical protein
MVSIARKIGIGAAAQQQVALQRFALQFRGRAQFGAAAEDGAQGLQADQGGHQLHGRGRLHGAAGQVRDHGAVVAQHQHADGVFGDAGRAQDLGHRFRQLGLGGQPGEGA